MKAITRRSLALDLYWKLRQIRETVDECYLFPYEHTRVPLNGIIFREKYPLVQKLFNYTYIVLNNLEYVIRGTLYDN